MPESLTTWAIVASIAGGAVCLKFFPEIKWDARLLSFICGSSCGLFLTPLVLYFGKLQDVVLEVKCSVHFLTGIFGQLALTVFQTKFQEGTWLKRIIPTPKTEGK